jgi:hypothetical protein
MSIFRLSPLRNTRWVAASIAAYVCRNEVAAALTTARRVALEVGFFAIFVAPQSIPIFSILTQAFYSVFFLFVLVIVAVDELVKLVDRRIFEREQKLLYLDFHTRLGAYSPD